jgi:ferritin
MRMQSKAVEAVINDQIAAEFYSAYLYLSMAAFFAAKNLPGFAHWMRVQYREEISHAERLFDFLVGKGGRVVLRTIEEPPKDFKGPLAGMEQALAHEQSVTGAIHQLYELAVKEKDYPTQLELQWFITEQVEEERTVSDIIAQLRLAGDSAPGLLMIDRQLAARGPTPS